MTTDCEQLIKMEDQRYKLAITVHQMWASNLSPRMREKINGLKKAVDDLYHPILEAQYILDSERGESNSDNESN